jgi:hypothetical protein
MYLYKHKEETASNKALLHELIYDKWARQIHNKQTKVVDADTAAEREQQEREMLQNFPRRRRSSGPSKQEIAKAKYVQYFRSCSPCIEHKSLSLSLTQTRACYIRARPGEEGFVARARVPTIATLDYINKPTQPDLHVNPEVLRVSTFLSTFAWFVLNYRHHSHSAPPQ